MNLVAVRSDDAGRVPQISLSNSSFIRGIVRTQDLLAHLKNAISFSVQPCLSSNGAC